MVTQHELCLQMALKKIADKLAPMFLGEVNLHNHHGQYNDFHRIKVNVVILHGAFKHEYRSRTAEMYI